MAKNRVTNSSMPVCSVMLVTLLEQTHVVQRDNFEKAVRTCCKGGLPLLTTLLTDRLKIGQLTWIVVTRLLRSMLLWDSMAVIR